MVMLLRFSPLEASLAAEHETLVFGAPEQTAFSGIGRYSLSSQVLCFSM